MTDRNKKKKTKKKNYPQHLDCYGITPSKDEIKRGKIELPIPLCPMRDIGDTGHPE